MIASVIQVNDLSMISPKADDEASAWCVSAFLFHLPSGSQTWQWKLHETSHTKTDDVPMKIPMKMPIKMGMFQPFLVVDLFDDTKGR